MGKIWLKEVKSVLANLILIAELANIKSNFVNKFTTITRQKNGKGNYFLHGEIKLCTTQSARPTSGGVAGINMLNLPSTGTPLAKPVKKCFTSSGKGRLMVGADYTGLEAMVGALLTRDPNNLKLYTDGYDAHSMRALEYFPELLPKHTQKIKDADTATEFYYDETKEGLDKWITN